MSNLSLCLDIHKRETSLSISYITALSVLLGISEKENWDSKYDHIQCWHFIA